MSPNAPAASASTSVATAAPARAGRAADFMIAAMFTDIATMSRPASAAVAPTIATLKSVHASSASAMRRTLPKPRRRSSHGRPGMHAAV